MSCTPLPKEITNAVRAIQLTQLSANLVKRIVLVTRMGELLTSTISSEYGSECFGESVQSFLCNFG